MELLDDFLAQMPKWWQKDVARLEKKDKATKKSKAYQKKQSLLASRRWEAAHTVEDLKNLRAKMLKAQHTPSVAVQEILGFSNPRENSEDFPEPPPNYYWAVALEEEDEARAKVFKATT